MRLLDLKDMTDEHFKTFSQTAELTPEEKAEVARLYWAQVSAEDLQEYSNWRDATSVDEFLCELKEEQRKWDELHP